MDPKIMSECRAIKMRKRMSALEAADKKKDRLYLEIPGLTQIDREISNIPAMMVANPEKARDIENIKKHTQTLYDKRNLLLTSAGYEEGYDIPQFDCTECRDTGYIGLELCSCMKKLYAGLSYKNSGIGGALAECRFDNFNVSLYTGDIKGDLHPRDIMEKIYDRAKQYAENFNNKSGNLLFLGSTGLGKTHLSAAVGAVVAEKGYTVVYETAQGIINDYRSNAFDDDTEADVKKYARCDLLIIDDLGTESKTEFSASVINELVNTRLINGRSMIISTNYSMNKMAEIYSPRVCSRIMGEFSMMEFAGRDIRIIKRML